VAIVGAERVHGAFAVATPVPLAGPALEAFEAAAEAIAARTDQAERAIENEALRADSPRSTASRTRRTMR
jgi:hypothetical protein